MAILCQLIQKRRNNDLRRIPKRSAIHYRFGPEFLSALVIGAHERHRGREFDLDSCWNVGTSSPEAKSDWLPYWYLRTAPPRMTAYYLLFP